MEFWKDKQKKILKEEIFSSEAENLAKKVFDERKGSDAINKPTQIRKFYDEVLRFDSIINLNPQDFNGMLPYLKMLNAKVAYAYGRNLVSKGFKDFITECINKIKDVDDFKAFVSFFEAFMGYYKFYDVKGKQQSHR